MTDTTITLPIQIDAVSVPAHGLKRITDLIATAGHGFGALIEGYGRAMDLAYFAPYQTPAKPQKHGLEEDLEGRDPNW